MPHEPLVRARIPRFRRVVGAAVDDVAFRLLIPEHRDYLAAPDRADRIGRFEGPVEAVGGVVHAQAKGVRGGDRGLLQDVDVVLLGQKGHLVTAPWLRITVVADHAEYGRRPQGFVPGDSVGILTLDLNRPQCRLLPVGAVC